MRGLSAPEGGEVTRELQERDAPVGSCIRDDAFESEGAGIGVRADNPPSISSREVDDIYLTPHAPLSAVCSPSDESAFGGEGDRRGRSPRTILRGKGEKTVWAGSTLREFRSRPTSLASINRIPSTGLGLIFQSGNLDLAASWER
jgi:hypothetical protein